MQQKKGSMDLVIVESPTKARKLKGYLGSQYQVEASVGHVRDLPKNALGVDIEHGYKPEYEISKDKLKVVATLRKLAQNADKVYLAMDPDREGEAIAWHVKYLLEHDDRTKKTKTTSTASKDRYLRSVFHEITKEAVLQAISHPGKLQMNLVDAQQARRVLDRLVGYQISPVLWRKIRRGLSAGRVQSVALRLIVEREREIAAFKPEEFWEVSTALAKQGSLTQKAQVFSKEGKVLAKTPAAIAVFSLEKQDDKKLALKEKSQTEQIVADLQEAEYRVTAVEKVERRRQSLPPFTTSLLQQAAATAFGFSVKQTMTLAQQLYEEGLITYHRTDSFNLAVSAVEKARQYIQDTFGAEFLPKEARHFAKTAKNAQEAHEAIRVTDLTISKEMVLEKSSRFTEQHQKLYDLIWRRFLASQMSEAVYDQTTVQVEAKKPGGHHKYGLKVVGSVLKFAGWRKLFQTGEDALIPDLAVNDLLDLHDLFSLQKFTQPPARYNDASLVKELEKRGIGRPSTYASIISVIVERGYVERQQRKFFATPIGMTVSDFLLEHFPDLMDYDFTAEMEEDLDRISRGEKEWEKVIDVFYKPLAKKIASVSKNADRVAVPVEETDELCPECQKLVAAGELPAKEAGKVVIRSGRFGKFKSCSRFPDCKYTENIVETLPDQKCPLCQQGDIIVRNTRFGKQFFGCSRYPECDWASWKKPEPGFRLTAKEWAEVKRKREEWKARFKKKEPAAEEKTVKTSAAAKTSKKTSSKSRPQKVAKVGVVRRTSKKTASKKVTSKKVTAQTK
jgi:DNA topoisomerase-1